MLRPGDTVYLAGPMRGKPNMNYDLFRACATFLRGKGFWVIDPSENFKGDQSRGWEDYMRVDMAHVLKADAVVVLSGWRTSLGACVECIVATAAGKPVYSSNDLHTPLPLTLIREFNSVALANRA